MRLFQRLLERLINSRFVTGLYNWQVSRWASFSARCHRVSFVTKKSVILSLIFAVLLSVTGYIVENMPCNLLEKSFVYYLLEKPFSGKAVGVKDNVAFINVSHDRQLVNLNPNDSLLGNVDITDRKKLLDFLQTLEQKKVNYRYIMMDVRFEKGLETDVDSMLYDQILKMRDIVIATHAPESNGGYEIADSRLLDKAGMSDYRKLGLVNNFSRYSFLQDEKPSIALKMYDDMRDQPTSIKHVGKLPLYLTGRRLCTNSPLMFISGNVYDKMTALMMSGNEKIDKSDQNIHYYDDMGADFLALEGRDWNADLDGCYIVIADFVYDTHDTYVGHVPGAYITWMAFQYLMNQRHILSWFFVVMLFISYLLVLLMLFYVNKLSFSENFVTKLVSQSFFRWFRWLGSIGFLYFVTYISYKFFNVRYNVTIPIIFVIVVNFIIKNANEYEKIHHTFVSGNDTHR